MHQVGPSTFETAPSSGSAQPINARVEPGLAEEVDGERSLSTETRSDHAGLGHGTAPVDGGLAATLASARRGCATGSAHQVHAVAPVADRPLLASVKASVGTGTASAQRETLVLECFNRPVAAELAQQIALPAADLAAPPLAGYPPVFLFALLAARTPAGGPKELTALLADGLYDTIKEASQVLLPPLPPEPAVLAAFCKLLGRTGQMDEALAGIKKARLGRPAGRDTGRTDEWKGDKESNQQRMLSVFWSPLTYSILDHVKQLQPAPVPGRRGRPVGSAPHPPELMFGLLVASRIYASRSEVARVLLDAAVYEQVRHAVIEMCPEVKVPLNPPTVDQLDNYAKSLARHDRVGLVLQAFMAKSVLMAQALGNLRPGVSPDWAHPSPRHVLHGDGTFVAPYSDAKTFIDPFTGSPITSGSKAKTMDRVRQQGFLTTPPKAEGHDKASGINFINVHTWTVYGRITVGIDWADSAELHAALRCLEAILQIAADGVHTVVYDRALAGWPMQWCAARHRVLVLLKSVASDPKSLGPNDPREADLDPEEEAGGGVLLPPAGVVDGHDRGATEPAQDRQRMAERLRRQTRRAVMRLAVELAAEPGADRRTDRPSAEQTLDGSRMLTDHYLNLAYAKMRAEGQLPVGVTIRRSSIGGYEVINSKCAPYGQVSHRLRDGRNCAHDLWVDDSRLWDTARSDSGELVKAREATCVRFEAGPGAGGHRFHSEWRLACDSGETLALTMTWSPSSRFGPAAAGERLAGREQAIAMLRPIGGEDEDPFLDVAGVRSDTESYNSWTKMLGLRNKGRAASENHYMQLLDMICTGVLSNAITWRRSPYATG